MKYLYIILLLLLLGCSSGSIYKISSTMNVKEIYKDFRQIDTSQLYTYSYKKMSEIKAVTDSAIDIISYRTDTLLKELAAYMIKDKAFHEVKTPVSIEINTEELGKRILNLKASSNSHLLYSLQIDKKEFAKYTEIQYLAVLINSSSNERTVFTYIIGDRNE